MLLWADQMTMMCIVFFPPRLMAERALGLIQLVKFNGYFQTQEHSRELIHSLHKYNGLSASGMETICTQSCIQSNMTGLTGHLSSITTTSNLYKLDVQMCTNPRLS